MGQLYQVKGADYEYKVNFPTATSISAQYAINEVLLPELGKM